MLLLFTVSIKLIKHTNFQQTGNDQINIFKSKLNEDKWSESANDLSLF